MKEIIKKFIPSFLINWYHFLLAFLGAVLYRFPSKELKVIGVTGTKGKSTVVELASKILEEAGYKVASVSSIRFKIADKEWQNQLKMTMPGRFKLQKFLREAKNSGCQYAIIEVTSEGILQHRHRFVDFEVAVFTNLAPEHIERHGSFEKYRQAKGKLFQSCQKVHILNLDDKNIGYFLKFPSVKKIFFTLYSLPNFPKVHFSLLLRSSKEKSYRVIRGEKIDCRSSQSSQSSLCFKIRDTVFNINLFGEFNIYNALAAIGIGISQGVSLGTSKKALEKIKGIPGRMEIVIEKPFKVIVDYAHTPDSLEKVYQTIRNPKSKILNSKQIQNSNFQNPKLICVLGAAGGGRDKWKRPKLGKIAAKYCNEIIITNEDPYDENPLKIIEEVAAGARGQDKVRKILDRREAIKKALALARSGDVVIITGKGSESWMCLAGGKRIPWDDRQIVREEFEKLNL
jgi:UDP-N-acetylmuramoyl-L-alanyl-D-glutamate--2,6-diaminopimelate ligase